MFVRQAVYDIELGRRLRAEFEVGEVQRQLNQLINRINRLGGENFLQDARMPHQMPTPAVQFNKGELRQLLALVHPDKHNGKESAEALTKKILKLRKLA